MKSAYSWGIGTGLGVVAYVALVAGFLTRANVWFGPEDGLFAPMLALLLLVFSAAVTGTLVFGRPALLALQDKRSKALRTLATTLVTIISTGAVIVLVRVLI